MKQLAWLSVAAIMISGCSGAEEATTAPTCDEIANYLDAMGECIPHTEPTMIVEGLPTTIQQFSSAEFTWSLDNGTRSAVHSMDSRILASATDLNVTNETGPDAWGTQVTVQKHKDFPDNFTAAFAWDEVELVYVKGYMLIDAVNVWVDLGTIDVTAVTSTANRTTIAISGTPPSVDKSEVSVVVGDGVTFDNGLLYEVTLSWVCTNGVTPPAGAIAAGTTLDVDFTVLTSCSYTLNTPLSVAPQDPGQTGGKVVVSRP